MVSSLYILFDPCDNYGCIRRATKTKLAKNTTNRTRSSSTEEKKKHRSESGVNLQPFNAANLSYRNTQQINSDTTSAEEFPWASLHEGGTNAHLMPTTVEEQNGELCHTMTTYILYT